MLVIGGRHKGVRMVINRTGADWVSAHRPGSTEARIHAEAAILQPLDVELSTEEVIPLLDDVDTPLWTDFEAYEHAAGRWRLHPRARVHRIADA